MHREYLFVDYSRDREAVEAVDEGAPDLDVVPPLACKNWSMIYIPCRDILRTLIVKSVNAIYRSGLVVPAEKEEVLGVLDFVRQK